MFAELRRPSESAARTVHSRLLALSRVVRVGGGSTAHTIDGMTQLGPGESSREGAITGNSFSAELFDVGMPAVIVDSDGKAC